MRFSVRALFLLLFAFFATSFCHSEDESQTSAEQATSEQQSPEKKKSITFNAINFLGDLLYDKYPLRIDFGAEPHRHGSMLFAAIDYDWSDSFSQRLRLEYDHYKVSTKSLETLSNQEVRSISIVPFPFVFFFGDGDTKSRERFTQFNIGIYFSHTSSKTDTGTFFSVEDSSNQLLSGFGIADVNQKYTIIGPAFGYSLNIPLFKYVSGTIEGFFVPAYIVFFTTESSATYHVLNGGANSTSSSVDYRSLSYPIAQQSVALDFFRYLRIKAQMTYQHLDLRAININDTEIETYSLHTITLRYGGELLKPARTRKKSSHLWAGLYYEMTWEKSYIQNTYNSDYTGKWVLCFGT